MRQKPTSAYVGTILFGGAGFFGMIVALFGAIYAREGRDPVDALGAPGIIAFLYFFVLALLAAYSFDDAQPPPRRHLLLTLLRAHMLASLAGTIACIVLLTTTRAGHLSMPTIFTAEAALCQIPGMLWVFRYSRENQN